MKIKKTLTYFSLADQGNLMAVEVGFEPTLAFTKQHFECCTFGRSDTPPSAIQVTVSMPIGTNPIGRMWRSYRRAEK